jgi:crotonobetainyl-CoA:carnitine CoA-transferase CaiB-like acyl-CoA transferase
MDHLNGVPQRGVLEGIKVVEFAHVIAGPLAGTLLADLGAEVVHVEDPGVGDPGRTMGPTKDGHGLWWKVSARNKRCVTLDLRSDRGQELARELVAWADVCITNVRVPALERWGLTWESCHEINPELVMLQVTGNGLTSSRNSDPGFGKVGEARSGVVQITGFPDGPPVHTGFSHADSVTALMGAFGIAAALTRRHDPDFQGEHIDLALFESLFRLIEWQVIVYDQLGMIPTRAGNQLSVAPGAVVNTYMTGSGDWITVTSGTPRSVQQIAALLGEPAEDYVNVEDQKRRTGRLDDLLRQWISSSETEECLEAMHEAGVVASRIYTMEDIAEDEIYREREDIVETDDEDLGPVRMQAVVPKFRNMPGRVWRTGTRLGADNELVFRDWLGVAEDDYKQLVADRVI